MAADLTEGVLQGSDETHRHPIRAVRQVVLDGLVHIPAGLLMQDDRFGLHRLAADRAVVRTRFRSPSNQASSTRVDGNDAAPASSKPRSRNRSWSLRMNSRTYSLLLP